MKTIPTYIQEPDNLGTSILSVFVYYGMVPSSFTIEYLRYGTILALDMIRAVGRVVRYHTRIATCRTCMVPYRTMVWYHNRGTLGVQST